MATNTSQERVFDIGINDRLSPPQFIMLGIQNVFGMTGMFVFPGILGASLKLPIEQIAYLYGMTFICCGIITILQSVMFLRLPIVQGPYAGSFAALMAISHTPQMGLGAAYGSFFVASIIWALMSIPIRSLSLVGAFAKFLRAPIISGLFVMLIMIQIASVALPNWIGLKTRPGFPYINLGAGAIAVVTIILVLVSGNFTLRRGGILLALLTGTICYAIFEPVSLDRVMHAPWFVEPKIFPWGFEVQWELVIEFLLVLIPAGMGSLALYQTVAEWGGEELTTTRMSEGIFGVALGSIVAGIFGGFSTIVYPDNIGMLRATRVGSRFATLAAGVMLIVLGGCIKFDFLLVIVPLPVISAAATLLFGIVFMHSIQILAKVTWDERHLITGGMAFLVGLGGMFVSPEVQAAMPLMLRLILQQPVVSGGVTLIILHALLCRNTVAKPSH